MPNIQNHIFNRKILEHLLDKEPEKEERFSKYCELKPLFTMYNERIRNSNIYKFSELEFQETFLTEIFEQALGYSQERLGITPGNPGCPNW